MEDISGQLKDRFFDCLCNVISCGRSCEVRGFCRANSMVQTDNRVFDKQQNRRKCYCGSLVVYKSSLENYFDLLSFLYEHREMVNSEGFFYSTIADLEESTSLSKSKQIGAVKALIDVGLVSTKAWYAG